jgi:ubiquinone biosynthesis protein
VERRVAADVRAMRLGAGLVEGLVPPARRLEPRALVATVGPFAPSSSWTCGWSGGGGGTRGRHAPGRVHCAAPEPVWEATGRWVLTQAGGGRGAVGPGVVEQAGLDRPALANNVIRGFLAQALEHGRVPCGPARGEPVRGRPDRVTAIDFGIVGRLTPFDRRIFAEVLWGFLRRDYQRVAEVHFEAGYVPASHDVGLFAQALRAVGEPIFGKDAREVGMGALLTQLFETTARFDMHLRPELVLLQKTMVTVEGVARRIDPAHDIWAAARRWWSATCCASSAPPPKVRRLAEERGRAVQALSRLADAPAPVVVVQRGGRLAWATLAVAGAALAIAAAALLA